MKVPPSARQAVAQGGRQENGERPQAYLSSTRWSISVRTAARRPSHLDQKSIRHQRGLFKPDNIATAALASTASLTGLGLGLGLGLGQTDQCGLCAPLFCKIGFWQSAHLKDCSHFQKSLLSKHTICISSVYRGFSPLFCQRVVRYPLPLVVRTPCL